MRIRKFYIDGFGIFHNCRIQGLSPGVNIFAGHNESGKSTLHAFFRHILLGFPGARQKRDVRYAPLRGGREGGSLWLVLDSGRELRLERRSGPHGGVPVLSSPDGSSAEDMNFAAITGGMTRELYRNIFAFSLNELQTFESLDADEIRAALYSAGMGAGIRKLSVAERFISSRKLDLFKPRGQKMVINTLLKEFDTVSREMAGALDENRKFEQMSLEQQELQEKIRLLREELRERRRDRTFFQVLMQIREQLSSLELVSARLAELCVAVPDFPEDGILRFERLDSMLDGMAAQLEEKSHVLSARLNEKKTLVIDRHLVAEKKAVTHAVSRLSLYIKAAEKLPDLENSAAILTGEIYELCVSLGQDWDVDRVRAVDRSMFTRDAIMAFRTEIREKRGGLLRLKEACREREEQYEQAGREVKDTEQELEIAVKEAGAVRAMRYKATVMEGDASCRALPAGHEAYEEFKGNFMKACDMRERLHQLEIRLGRLEMELERGLAALDLGWDVERIRNSGISPGIIAEINEQQDEFQQVQAETGMLASMLSQAEEKRQDILKHMESAGGKLAELSSQSEALALPDLAQARRGLETLRDIEISFLLLEERKKTARDRLEGIEKTARNADQALKHVEEGQSEGHGYIWFPLTFTVCAAAAWYWLAVRNGLTLQGSAATLLFLASAALFFMHGFLRIRSDRMAAEQTAAGHKEQIRISHAEAENISAALEKIDNEMHALKASAMLVLEDADMQLETVMESPSFALGIRKAAGALAARIREYEEITGHAQSIREELNRSERNLTETYEEIETIRVSIGKAENRRNKLEAAWQSYLSSMHIDSDVSFDQMKSIIPGIDSCRKELAEIDRLNMEIESCREYVHSYLVRMEEFTGYGYLSEIPLPDAFERVRGLLEHMGWKQDRIREIDQKILIAQNRLSAAEKQVEHARTSLEKYREMVHEAEKELSVLLNRWDQWLNDCGFEAGLSPDMLLDAMAVMDRILEKHAALMRINIQKQEASDIVKNFMVMLEELFARLGRVVPPASEVVWITGQLQEELEQALILNGRKQELMRETDALEKEISSMRHRMQKITDERTELISRAGARSPAEFREKHRMFVDKERLLRDQAAHMDTMKKLAAGHDLDAMIKKIETRSLEDIAAEVEELNDTIKILEDKMETAALLLGELGHRLSGLANSRELGRLRQKQECLREEIGRMCRRWSTYAVAEYLIDQTKKYFEKERQPEVIRNAGNFFTQITAGRYAGIVAPAGRDEIHAITTDNDRISPENLSRGTAEQLYLALRLGYITCRNESAESMPVLMDDILVNFDPRRAKAAAETIVGLAEEVQVIFLTCHAETVNIFRNISANGNRHAMNIYNITHGSISPGQRI